MFGRRVTLFKILGFKVQLDVSWMFLAVLVTWSLARGYFPAHYLGLSDSTYWWMGTVGAIGLFGSIVFHELAHSLVARHYGIPISSITLFIFGGVAQMEKEPPSPKAEFLMAIAGPISSFALSAASYLAFEVGYQVQLPLSAIGVLGYLAFANSLLGGFNLIPAFPLDGGTRAPGRLVALEERSSPRDPLGVHGRLDVRIRADDGRDSSRDHWRLYGRRLVVRHGHLSTRSGRSLVLPDDRAHDVGW